MKNNLINRQTNEEEEERKSKYISGIATFVLTASLFVLMWFWKFTYPKPDVLAEESAVMVSLGEPDLGGPNDVPVEPDYTPPTPPTPDTDEAVEQTEDPDAVATKKTEEKKTQEKPKTTPVEKTKPQEEDDLIKKMREKMNKNKTNTGSGDPTKNNGNKGDPNGSPTGNTNGSPNGGPTGGPTGGVGKGTSTSHSFGNRKLTSKILTDNCNDKGTVIVDVILKPDGTIIPEGINPGTKSTSECLRNLALKIARSSRFDAKSDASQTEGTITYKFTQN